VNLRSTPGSYHKAPFRVQVRPNALASYWPWPVPTPTQPGSSVCQISGPPLEAGQAPVLARTSLNAQRVQTMTP
jgi:hypothetical protein